MPTLSATVGLYGQNAPADARLVQQLLNRFVSPSDPLLDVDGGMGPLTLTAIKEFQEKLGLTPDGLITPDGETFTALCGGDTSVMNIAWGARVSPEFKERVLALCDSLLIPVDFLMSAMAFESGESFSPSVKNAAGSGAVGLIQFMPSTAKALGTTTADLAAMTAVEQLDYVEKYFAPRAGKLQSVEDVYMAILYPAAIGKAAAAALFTEPSVVYTQNRGLDADRDGKITVAECAACVRAKFHKGLQAANFG